jgi:hypothetical protein
MNLQAFLRTAWTRTLDSANHQLSQLGTSNWRPFAKSGRITRRDGQKTVMFRAQVGPGDIKRFKKYGIDPEEMLRDELHADLMTHDKDFIQLVMDEITGKRATVKR